MKPTDSHTERRDEPKQAWSTPRLEELDVNNDTAGSPGPGFDIVVGS